MASKLSDRMRRLREVSGARYEDIAVVAGCSTAQIGHLCTGFRDDPAVSTLVNLSRAFRVDLLWLITGEGVVPSDEDIREGWAKRSKRRRRASTRTKGVV